MGSFFFILALALAIIPSIIWLLFYLRKDSHPEPNWMVLTIFLLGAISILPAVGLEKIASYLCRNSVIILIASAFIEEIVKFFAARFGTWKKPALDEPVDVMLYMIIAGLGFAALENFFFLLDPTLVTPLHLVEVSITRFLGATFIHALASGTWGYFIALNYFSDSEKPSKKRLHFWVGLLLAGLLHSAYNLSIIIALRQQSFTLAFSLIILLILIFINIGNFRKLKKKTAGFKKSN